MTKKRYPTARTPKGTGVYPRLNEPDTKFAKPGELGTYSVKLAYDGTSDELDAFVAQAEKVRDEFFDEKAAELVAAKKGGIVKLMSKSPVATAEIDKETGDETGRLILNVKMNAGGIIKNGPRAGQQWSQKPDYFDAKGNSLRNPPRIGGGSELKAIVELEPYFVEKDKTVGVSLRLQAVQIIKLVTGGSRSFSEYGFAEEDGDEIEDQAPAPAPASASGFANEAPGDDDDI